jgi:hypothetical protein
VTARKAAPKRRAAAHAVQPKPVRTTSAARASASQRAPTKAGKPRAKAAKVAPAPRPRRAKAAPAPPKATAKPRRAATKAKPATLRKPAKRKTPAKPRAARMSAVASVKRDLKRLPDHLAESAEAATALAMAERLDLDEGSPSECAKALMDAMARLRAMAPPEEKRGELHDIRSARALRLAPGGSAGEG